MYTILTDSCSDLNAQIAARFAQLEVLPLSYTISGQTSTQPFDDAARCSAFYDRLRAGETCTTSQVSPGDFAEAFKAHAKKGEAVLGLIFSSALSGTYASACMARDMVLEEYPDAVIELVDTLSASAGEGMVVYDALLRRDAGMPIEENAVYTKAHLQEYAHWFTVDDLHFLKRGGRCSPSAERPFIPQICSGSICCRAANTAMLLLGSRPRRRRHRSAAVLTSRSILCPTICRCR